MVRMRQQVGLSPARVCHHLGPSLGCDAHARARILSPSGMQTSRPRHPRSSLPPVSTSATVAELLREFRAGCKWHRDIHT